MDARRKNEAGAVRKAAVEDGSPLEEFAGAVSHELRGPLNTLTVALSCLRNGVLRNDGDHLPLTDVMDVAIRRAVVLLDTMQTLALAEDARTGSRLTETVTRVVQQLSDEARWAGVHVQVETPLPDVLVESTLSYIVLANTIGNAIKYHDAGKDECRVRVSVELLEEELDSGSCAVTVEDNGVGIPEALVSRVFDYGFRAHPERCPGTGLGLSLVRRAVHSRGGRVDLRSEEGKGTTVVARIRCFRPTGGSGSAEPLSVESVTDHRGNGDARRAERP